MATLWITYAWADNKSKDIDFIAQELEKRGVKVRLDRWDIEAGKRLWQQIDQFIASKDLSDAWMIVATQNSLSSSACQEEFAYALDRALRARGEAFPVLALFRGPVDDSLIPTALKIRLHVSMTDPDWQERIVAAAEGRSAAIAKPVVAPFALDVQRNHPSGRILIQIRPRAGAWAPVFVAIPASEKNAVRAELTVEPTGAYGGALMSACRNPWLSDDGKWWIEASDDQASPTRSMYVAVDSVPSQIRFGVLGAGPDFLEKLG